MIGEPLSLEHVPDLHGKGGVIDWDNLRDAYAVRPLTTVHTHPLVHFLSTYEK